MLWGTSASAIISMDIASMFATRSQSFGIFRVYFYVSSRQLVSVIIKIKESE